MSVEVDFGEFNQVFQAANTQVGWTTTWSLMTDSNHFIGSSIIPDSNQSILTVISQGFENDIHGSILLHQVVQSGPHDALFRVAVIQAPNRT